MGRRTFAAGHVAAATPIAVFGPFTQPRLLFARIARFQGLVYSLLSTDVSEWAGVAPDAGFYDQAHMIDEFRSFTGAPANDLLPTARRHPPSLSHPGPRPPQRVAAVRRI